MVALDQIKAFIAAVELLGVTEHVKNKVVSDKRWEVIMKIGSTLVHNIWFCAYQVDFIDALQNKVFVKYGRLQYTY